jgi:hypothetical protein
MYCQPHGHLLYQSRDVHFSDGHGRDLFTILQLPFELVKYYNVDVGRLLLVDEGVRSVASNRNRHVGCTDRGTLQKFWVFLSVRQSILRTGSCTTPSSGVTTSQRASWCDIPAPHGTCVADAVLDA